MLQTIANPRTVLRLLAAAAGLSLAAAAPAQQYQPPPPPLTTAPCVPTKKDPCAVAPADTRPPDTVEKFPFPGDTPAAPAQPAQKSSPTTTTPGQPAFPFPGEPTPAAPTDPSAAKSFPFPGENVPDLPGAPGSAPNSAPTSEPAESSSSSSSSSSSRSPDDAPALKDEGSSGSTRFARRHLAKVEDPDTRESKDLEISRYYASIGNFQAAYLRAKDAVTTIPDDPAAHFVLAESAQKLHKTDEAAAEYNAYLKLEPEGDHAAAARKALAGLPPAPAK